MVTAGAIVLTIILAVVFGAIFGSRHTNSMTTPSQPSNSSATASPALLPRRNIAALSFEANSINNTHVYFLDNQGRVLEAANSSKNKTWVTKTIGSGAKKGSAIAAAVSRPYFPLVTHLPNK